MLSIPSIESIDYYTLLFHFSNLAAFLSFLLRDQMKLRLLMGVSLLLQAVYYYAIPGGPLVDSLFWKTVSFLANLLMIAITIHDNLDIGIPDYLRSLFVRLRVLTPGQFRKLVSGVVRIEGTGQTILNEGEIPTRLYFLLSGQASISKAGQVSVVIPSGAFLGEIAFLNRAEASATVALLPGATALYWQSAELRELMEKDSSIDIAMRGFFNHDLSHKLARSIPIARVQETEKPVMAETV